MTKKALNQIIVFKNIRDDWNINILKNSECEKFPPVLLIFSIFYLFFSLCLLTSKRPPLDLQRANNTGTIAT